MAPQMARANKGHQRASLKAFVRPTLRELKIAWEVFSDCFFACANEYFLVLCVYGFDMRAGGGIRLVLSVIVQSMSKRALMARFHVVLC